MAIQPHHRTQSFTFLFALISLFSFGTLPSTLRAACDWAYGFHARDFDGPVHAFTVWDDGTGEALYAAGEFARAEDIAAAQIARWDGNHWWPLIGVNGDSLEPDEEVHAMVVWNGDLYVGGFFTSADGTTVNHIARWDGTTWWPLTGASGTGTNAAVHTLLIWDDGSGEALYVGGEFDQAGGLSAERIARWDGGEWSALVGGGLEGRVRALEVFDDGNGAALYAGGDFEEADDLDLEVNYIARWDGSVWSGLDGPTDVGLSTSVYDLLVKDGLLFVAGDFVEAGGIAADRIATWDGLTWAPLSSEVFSGKIVAMQTWDDGLGDRLYVVGDFRTIDGQMIGYVARRDGATWTALPGGDEDVGLDYYGSALIPFDAGDGEALYLGGFFRNVGSPDTASTAAGGAIAHHMARWDGTRLSPLPNSLAQGLTDTVYDMTTWDDGFGEALYAVGTFQGAGAITAPNIAKWNGQRWAPVGELGDVSLTDIVVWDGDLYVGGEFATAAGVPMHNIARWNGTSWSPLTGGSGTGVGGSVNALAVWDDGGGEALYVGGSFATAGGVVASNIAKWDGSDFSALGSGTDDTVRVIAGWDDGGGEDLYVGGQFITAGGLTVNRIARWDGAAWSALTGASGTGTEDQVNALTRWEGDLYLGGHFGRAGGVDARSVAQWDGSEFSPLADGGFNGVAGRVNTLYTFDDGSGEAIFAGVTIFGGSIGAPVGGLGAWDGHGFVHLGIPTGPVTALAGYAGAEVSNPALFVGGNIASAGNVLSDQIAMRTCDTVPPTGPTLLESPSHEVGVVSGVLEITVNWEGAIDTGGSGLHGYSYVFDGSATTVPDKRIDTLHADGVLSVTTAALAAGKHYFHLRTCDRRRGCTTDHLGPFLIDDGSVLFWDGFESGDMSAWSSSNP